MATKKSAGGKGGGRKRGRERDDDRPRSGGRIEGKGITRKAGSK